MGCVGLHQGVRVGCILGFIIRNGVPVCGKYSWWLILELDLTREMGFLCCGCMFVLV